MPRPMSHTGCATPGLRENIDLHPTVAASYNYTFGYNVATAGVAELSTFAHLGTIGGVRFDAAIQGRGPRRLVPVFISAALIAFKRRFFSLSLLTCAFAFRSSCSVALTDGVRERAREGLKYKTAHNK